MPQSLSNFSNALKEIYEPGLRNAVNNSNAVWAEAIKNTEDLIGEEAVWSIHSGRSASTGNRAELAALPTPDRQRHIKARKGLKFAYHTIKVSGPAKHLTRNDEGAFARALEAEVKGGEKDIKNDLSRQTFGQSVTVNGTPQTGVIATLSADPGAGTTFTIANEDTSIVRHFHPGMILQVFDPATGTARTGTYEVVSTDRSAKTIEVDAAADAGITTGDVLVRNGNLNEEIDGLRSIISSGDTYAGIDGSNVPVWNSESVGSASTGISEVLLDEAVEVVETDGDGSTIDFFYGEHVQRRKLASLLQAQKRYEGRDMTLTSGWKGLQLARGVFLADRYCPTTDIFGVHKPDIQKFIGLDFQWDDDDGDVFFKALDGSDAVEARFKGYIQLAGTNRNSHVKVKVSEPTF